MTRSRQSSTASAPTAASQQSSRFQRGIRRRVLESDEVRELAFDTIRHLLGVADEKREIRKLLAHVIICRAIDYDGNLNLQVLQHSLDICKKYGAAKDGSEICKELANFLEDYSLYVSVPDFLNKCPELFHRQTVVSVAEFQRPEKRSKREVTKTGIAQSTNSGAPDDQEKHNTTEPFRNTWTFVHRLKFSDLLTDVYQKKHAGLGITLGRTTKNGRRFFAEFREEERLHSEGLLTTVREEFTGWEQRGLKDVLRRFCELFEPDCYTAYFWNPRWNRPEQIDFTKRTPTERSADGRPSPNGIAYPEATHGFLRAITDLPNALFRNAIDGHHQLIYLPEDFASINAEMPRGGFIYRENIDPKRVLCFRLPCDGNPTILILNWRKKGEPEQVPYESPSYVGSHPTPLAIAVKHCFDFGEDLKAVLRPAVQHFAGWLTSSIDLSTKNRFAERAESRHTSQIGQEHHGTAETEPTRNIPSIGGARSDVVSAVELCNKIWQVAQTDKTSTAARNLTSAVEDALKLKAKEDDARIHWVHDDLLHITDYDKDEEFVRNEPDDLRPPYSVNLDDIDNGVLFRKSVSRAAAAWRCSLLVDLESKRKLPGTKRPTRQAVNDPDPTTWKGIDVRRCDAARYEIVVPILKGERTCLGVINIQSNRKLQPSEVRQLEVMAFLYQKLYTLRTTNKLSAWLQRQLDMLMPKAQQPFSFHIVCRQLCKVLCGEAKARLVRLLFFNPLIEAYLPFATSLDEGTAKEFLEKEKSVFDDTSKMLDAFRKPNTGRNDDNANNEIAKKERKREEKRTRILSLIESLISWRLLARRQGAVDLVYRTGIPQFVPPAKMPVSAREYFEGGAILLPLRQDCSAQPDGVIGISWKDDKDNRAQQIKAHFENRDGSHAEWGDFRVLTEVFACVLALHRCSDEKLTDEFPPFVPNRE